MMGCLLIPRLILVRIVDILWTGRLKRDPEDISYSTIDIVRFDLGKVCDRKDCVTELSFDRLSLLCFRWRTSDTTQGS
jgi:hypothetical protein